MKPIEKTEKLRKKLGYNQTPGIFYEVIEKPDYFLMINSLLGRTSFYSKRRPVVGIKVKKDGHDPEIMYIEVSSIEKAEMGMLIIKGRLLHYLTKCEIYIRYSEASGLLVRGSSYLEIIIE